MDNIVLMQQMHKTFTPVDDMGKVFKRFAVQNIGVQTCSTESLFKTLETKD